MQTHLCLKCAPDFRQQAYLTELALHIRYELIFNSFFAAAIGNIISKTY